MIILSIVQTLDLARSIAVRHHPSKIYRHQSDSHDLLPAWDAERFERLRQNAGATGEESHE